MKILVTGANGQLGSEIVECVTTMRSEIGPIPQEYLHAKVDALTHRDLDITDSASVDHVLSREHYDLVVNCAAFTNVDGCESNEEYAYLVNAIGAQNVARAAASRDAKLIQLSTDYVFPGTEPKPRVESDKVAPISAYGRTKLAGERLVLADSNKAFVIRTAWLYGYKGKNFVKTMRSLGSKRESVMVVDDQLGNPTSANDLAYELLRIALTEDYGVYHVTGEGVCSWAQFAASIMEKSKLGCRVIPISSEQYKQMYPTSADRPHYSSLENKRLVNTIGNRMRSWEVALSDYIERLDKRESANERD